MLDFATARLNMVESQVRPNGITDPRIIDIMSKLPRENFVPGAKRDVAYTDEDIPLMTAASGGPQRYVIEPMAFARLVQLAAIGEKDSVLHIGAATGYGTAVLAQLAGHVTAVEENPELADIAKANLADIGNVSVVTGALYRGHPGAAPYDVVFIEGRISEIPGDLTTQLKDGGRMVAVIGDPVVAKGICVTRSGQALSQQRGFDATVGELPGFAAQKAEFAF